MSSPAHASKAERRRRVFLAARGTFVGTNAHIRDRNMMVKVISQNEQPFLEVIQSFSKAVVYDITRSLLVKEVFESELKAKLQFPELYSVSAVRGLQHDVSEQDAARSEQEVLQEIDESDDSVQQHQDEADSQKSELEEHTIKDEHLKSLSMDLPSLFPSYLSYSVQHRLLNGVQKLLEECCYGFATKLIPNVLEERKWDCAEAVELGSWCGVLLPHFDKISTEATAFDSEQALQRVFAATYGLRHAAVHRKPTHCKGLEQMLKDALRLVGALQDEPRISKLEALLQDLHSKRQDMELAKNHLENQLDEELMQIQGQRAALDRKEKEAKERLVRLDIENTKSVSSLFGRSIDSLNRERRDQGPEQDIVDKDSEPIQDSTSRASSLEAVNSISGEIQVNGGISDATLETELTAECDRPVQPGTSTPMENPEKERTSFLV